MPTLAETRARIPADDRQGQALITRIEQFLPTNPADPRLNNPQFVASLYNAQTNPFADRLLARRDEFVRNGLRGDVDNTARRDELRRQFLTDPQGLQAISTELQTTALQAWTDRNTPPPLNMQTVFGSVAGGGVVGIFTNGLPGVVGGLWHGIKMAASNFIRGIPWIADRMNGVMDWASSRVQGVLSGVLPSIFPAPTEPAPTFAQAIDNASRNRIISNTTGRMGQNVNPQVWNRFIGDVIANPAPQTDQPAGATTPPQPNAPQPQPQPAPSASPVPPGTDIAPPAAPVIVMPPSGPAPSASPVPPSALPGGGGIVNPGPRPPSGGRVPEPLPDTLPLPEVPPLPEPVAPAPANPLAGATVISLPSTDLAGVRQALNNIAQDTGGMTRPVTQSATHLAAVLHDVPMASHHVVVRMQDNSVAVVSGDFNNDGSLNPTTITRIGASGNLSREQEVNLPPLRIPASDALISAGMIGLTGPIGISNVSVLNALSASPLSVPLMGGATSTER